MSGTDQAGGLQLAMNAHPLRRLGDGPQRRRGDR